MYSLEELRVGDTLADRSRCWTVVYVDEVSFIMLYEYGPIAYDVYVGSLDTGSDYGVQLAATSMET